MPTGGDSIVETDSLVRAVAAAPVREPPIALSPGSEVDSLFEIIGLLGRGGMGSVYKAHDRDLDRTVALKLHSRAGDVALRRMRREARAMARVTHPNVITVHAVGIHCCSLYIAMEYAPDGSLRQWLETPRRRRARRKSRLLSTTSSTPRSARPRARSSPRTR